MQETTLLALDSHLIGEKLMYKLLFDTIHASNCSSHATNYTDTDEEAEVITHKLHCI